MSNFKFGIESMGVPLIGSGIPASFGDYFFVDVERGSDGSHDGLSMDEPFKTVKKAYDTARTNQNDVIVLSAVGTHTLIDEIIWSKNRIHLVGLGGGSRYMGQRTKVSMGVTTGSAKAILQITGIGNTFTNIKFRSTDTLATSLYCIADGGEFTQFTHCWMEKATDLDQTGAAELLCNSDTGFYKNCTIGNTIYEVSVARANILFTREIITGKVARDVIFEHCLILNKTSAAGSGHFKATANDVERLMLFKKCTFWTAKTSSATQALVALIASALTDAEILLQDCVVQNVTNVADNTKGIFTNSPTPVANATESVAVHTS